MKRCTLLLSLCLLLCACTPAPGESAPPPDATAGAQTAETAETATGESAGASTTLPAGLEPLDREVLDYDNIRLVCRFSVWNEPVPGYFTASRDGQWGLLRNDGSEVLPCTFDRPVALCFRRRAALSRLDSEQGRYRRSLLGGDLTLPCLHRGGGWSATWPTAVPGMRTISG